MTVIYVICIICVLAMLITILKLCKKYKELYEMEVQEKTMLITLSEFVVHIKSNLDEEIVATNMVNAVKTCVNKGIYEIKPVDDDYTEEDTYYGFAGQMFKFVEEMDKE